MAPPMTASALAVPTIGKPVRIEMSANVPPTMHLVVPGTAPAPARRPPSLPPRSGPRHLQRVAGAFAPIRMRGSNDEALLCSDPWRGALPRRQTVKYQRRIDRRYHHEPASLPDADRCCNEVRSSKTGAGGCEQRLGARQETLEPLAPEGHRMPNAGSWRPMSIDGRSLRQTSRTAFGVVSCQTDGAPPHPTVQALAALIAGPNAEDFCRRFDGVFWIAGRVDETCVARPRVADATPDPGKANEVRGRGQAGLVQPCGDRGRHHAGNADAGKQRRSGSRLDAIEIEASTAVGRVIACSRSSGRCCDRGSGLEPPRRRGLLPSPVTDHRRCTSMHTSWTSPPPHLDPRVEIICMPVVSRTVVVGKRQSVIVTQR